MHFVHCASDSPPLALRRFRLYSFGAGHRRLFGLRRVTMIVIIIIRHHKRHCHRHHRGHCHRAIRGPGLPPSSSLRSWTRQPRHSRGAGARRGPRDRGTHPTRTQREDKMSHLRPLVLHVHMTANKDGPGCHMYPERSGSNNLIIIHHHRGSHHLDDSPACLYNPVQYVGPGCHWRRQQHRPAQERRHGRGLWIPSVRTWKMIIRGTMRIGIA